MLFIFQVFCEKKTNDALAGEEMTQLKSKVGSVVAALEFGRKN